jgi:hypothetical protein
MKKFLFIVLIIISFTSCKVTSFGGDQSKALTSQPLLGTVGSFREGMTSTSFVEAGVPQLAEKIRLDVQKKPFQTGSLKKYNLKVLKEEEKLESIDSIDFRPDYFFLEISDKVGLIKALNGQENEDLRNFLEVTQKQVILSSMRIYFPSEISVLIDQASEVYLVNNKKSSYSLELLDKDRSREIIEFSEGTSFGYNFSAFCWGENQRHKAEIAALRERNRSCPGKTKKNPDKVRSKDVFDKL